MSSARLWAVCLVALACDRANPAFYPGLGRQDAGGPADDGGGGGDLGGGGGPGDTSPAPADASQPEVAADRAPDGAPDLPAGTFVPPAGCGLLTTAVEGVRDADGVVIDPVDGRLYLLTADNWVGRSLPGESAAPRWQSVGVSGATYGLALDSVRARLYVLTGGNDGSLVAFDDIRGMPRRSTFLTGMDDGNDVVVGPDGSVYYSQQGDHHVYRVPATGGPAAAVTTSVIGSDAASQAPAALAAHADGTLWVGVSNGGPVFRLTLMSSRETGRTRAGTFTGWANGLTFDLAGRLYIANYHDTVNQDVLRLETTGPPTRIATGGRFSSIAFGRAPLDCRDIYIADPYGPMRRVRVTDALDPPAPTPP